MTVGGRSDDDSARFDIYSGNDDFPPSDDSPAARKDTPPPPRQKTERRLTPRRRGAYDVRIRRCNTTPQLHLPKAGELHRCTASTDMMSYYVGF